MAYDDAIAGLESGWRYFGVVPRWRRGNKKADCVRHFDVLWVDMDKEAGVDPRVLLKETVEKLPRELHPSLVNFSGNRGIHCYWKLDTLLPIEEIEQWNCRLAEVVGGDKNCHDCTRLLTNPGTPHRTTRRLVEIIDFSAEVHPAERLGLLPEIEVATPARGTAKAKKVERSNEEWLAAAEALNCWGDPPDINLSARLSGVDLGYLRGSFRQGWKRGEQTRSDVEMSIVYRLVGEGASDDQIRDLADAAFSKHIEVKGRRGYDYIDRTIRSARREWYAKGWLTHPTGGRRKQRAAKHRHASLAERESYLELVRGQLLPEWVSEVTQMGKSRQSAYRYKDGFEREGLVEIKDGRIVRIIGQ